MTAPIVAAFDTYVELALRTDATTLESPQTRLAHGSVGLAGELHELPLTYNPASMLEEAGDMFWFLALVCRSYSDLYGVSVQDLLRRARDVSTLVGRHRADTPETPVTHLTCLAVCHGVGQLCQAAKRASFYVPPGLVANDRSREELRIAIVGLFEALQLACAVHDVHPSSALDRNIEKLRTRYPDRYSLAASDARDTDLEQEVLNAR